LWRKVVIFVWLIRGERNNREVWLLVKSIPDIHKIPLVARHLLSSDKQNFSEIMQTENLTSSMYALNR
jgi:hypothetical protein